LLSGSSALWSVSEWTAAVATRAVDATGTSTDSTMPARWPFFGFLGLATGYGYPTQARSSPGAALTPA
jgi:hypothetical protein